MRREQGEGGENTLGGRSPNVSLTEPPIFHRSPLSSFDVSHASAAASPPVLHEILMLSLSLTHVQLKCQLLKK